MLVMDNRTICRWRLPAMLLNRSGIGCDGFLAPSLAQNLTFGKQGAGYCGRKARFLVVIERTKQVYYTPRRQTDSP